MSGMCKSNQWTAGWNTPGCLPEVTPNEFETRDEAVSYLSDVIDSFWDEDFESDPGIPVADDRWVGVAEALLYGDVSVTRDGALVFWVQKS